MARWRTEGDAGLEPHSKRPKTSPTAIAPEVVEAMVTLRRTCSCGPGPRPCDDRLASDPARCVRHRRQRTPPAPIAPTAHHPGSSLPGAAESRSRSTRRSSARPGPPRQEQQERHRHPALRRTTPPHPYRPTPRRHPGPDPHPGPRHPSRQRRRRRTPARAHPRPDPRLPTTEQQETPDRIGSGVSYVLREDTGCGGRI